jgi:hypothetical protein
VVPTMENPLAIIRPASAREWVIIDSGPGQAKTRPYIYSKRLLPDPRGLYHLNEPISPQ